MFIALNVWSQGEIKRHERNLLFALYALYCMTSYFFLIYIYLYVHDNHFTKIMTIYARQNKCNGFVQVWVHVKRHLNRTLIF